MKRNILAVLSVALLAIAGCAKFEHETPADPIKVSAPAISITPIDDYSFEATISPVSGTGFYSYAVLKGEPQDLSASSVFKVAVKSALLSGTVDYSKNPSYTILVDDIEPNTTYTVYAIAASQQGTVGELVFMPTLTSDGKAPELVDYDQDGNVVTLYYDENIKYVEGNDVTGVVYAKLYVAGNPVIAKTTAKVSVKGSAATLVFDDVTVPGSYYTVAFPEGTFVDMVGNKAAEVEAGKFSINSKYVVSYTGEVYGYTENDDIDVDVDYDDIMTDYSSYIYVMSATMLNRAYANKVVVTVSGKNDNGDTVTTEHTLSGAPYYGVLSVKSYADALGVKLDSKPAGGSEITINIPAETFQDIYGNYNAEIEIGPMTYTYGLDVDDIAGTYTFKGTSVFGADYNEDDTDYVIAASDNEDKGNVMITSLFGLDCKVYADFDGDAGTYTVSENYEYINSEYTTIDGDKYRVDYYTYGYYDDEIVYTIHEPHTFSARSDYFGYYAEYYVYDADEDAYVYDDYSYNLFAYAPIYQNASASAALVGSFKTIAKDSVKPSRRK